MWLFLLVSISPVVSLHFLAHTCCQICDAAYIFLYSFFCSNHCNSLSLKFQQKNGQPRCSMLSTSFLQSQIRAPSTWFTLNLLNFPSPPLKSDLNPHVPAFFPKFLPCFLHMFPTFPDLGARTWPRCAASSTARRTPRSCWRSWHRRRRRIRRPSSTWAR